jgi:Domain of unknown function (DUF202)
VRRSLFTIAHAPAYERTLLAWIRTGTSLITFGFAIRLRPASGSAYAQTNTAQEDRAVARACKADAEHVCAGMSGQQLQQCLKSNRAKLSANCKDAVSKLPSPPK